MKLKYIFILSVVLVATSCKVGKNYQRPDLALPENYRHNSSVNMPADTVIYPPHTYFRNEALLSLLDTAIAKNNDLLIAVKNIEAASWSLKAAKLNFFPELNAQVNGNYTHASKNSATGQAGGSRITQDYNLSAALTWDIDIWGKIRRNNEAALAAYLQTEEARKAVQTRLVADVAKGYYNLLMLDEQLNIARQTRELTESSLSVTKKQYEVGDANILAIKQVEAQLEQNNLLISQIEQSVFSQENALNLLCGNYAKEIVRRSASDDEFRIIPTDGYPVSALVARPDVRAAEYALRVANAKVGVAQAEMYPALNISLTGGINSLKTSNWFSIPASLFGTVAGGLTQPIFSRGRLRTNLEQAKIEREKEVINFRQKVLEGYSEVSNAINNRQELEKQYIFALNRVRSLENGVKSANVLFKVGSVDYLDIISVQSNYLQARLESTQIYTNKAISNIDLYYALGGGW